MPIRLTLKGDHLNMFLIFHLDTNDYNSKSRLIQKNQSSDAACWEIGAIAEATQRKYFPQDEMKTNIRWEGDTKIKNWMETFLQIREKKTNPLDQS